MSTHSMRGLAARITELKRTLRKRKLSEWDRRYAEYKLAEAEFYLWAETEGWRERQAVREAARSERGEL